MDEAMAGAHAAMQVAIAHRELIEIYAFAITRDPHLVEDVRQEVTLVLASHHDRLPHGDGLVLWLKEVVRRKSLELLRQQRRRGRLLSPEAMAQVEAALPVETAPGHDLAIAMADCVAKLAGDARIAIAGRYAERLDVPSIAARIGRSVQGTYAVLKRARLALEACVEQAGHRQGEA